MTKFSDLELDEKVLRAVTEAGYETPTPIQEQAIPHALMGKDVLGIAQTGTGKTASFTLPMITILAQGRAKARMPRSLILCPTRELAAQVAENFETYGKYHKLSMALLIGGVSFKDQDKLIDRGVDVLIATPGRLLDHHERGKLMLTGVQVMVVDEADRMLDMGFIPDIERIFSLTPFTRQTLFFSATMAPEITRITETFLHNPVRVEVARQATTSETIEQAVIIHRPSGKKSADSEKREVLRRVIASEAELTNGIIFCNRKRDVDIVAKSLKKSGMDAAAIHGDLDQSVRTKTLTAFRDGELKLLVASDVAARGLDIPNVSHVFNFDVPIHSEDYVHRIGRTGRAGRKGKAIMICFPHEEKHLDKIEELVKKPIPRRDSPLTEAAAAEGEGAEPQAEDKPARSRSRSRSRRSDDKPAESKVETKVEAPVAEAAQDEAPAPQDASPAPRARRSAPAEDKPRGERQERQERGSDRNADRNSDRPQGRGRGRGGRGEDNRVVGMGDHVPAFMLREITLPSRAAKADDDGDDGAEEGAAA